MAGKVNARLHKLTDFLTHVRAVLQLDFGFRLWNGVCVPPDLSDRALAIKIADEGVIAALLRRPSLETVGHLFVADRLDILNGTIFDLAERRPTIKSRTILKTLDKKKTLALALAFLFVPRGGPWPLADVGRRGSMDGSSDSNKENVSYHYDLSNGFYQAFLDPSMVYSCGYFHDWSQSLAQAQFNKLDMSCRRLRLQPGERLLDIGCGWGAMVCHAAEHYGAICDGITLSEQQFALATQRVAERGLQDKVTIRLIDYAAVQGEYDKISSIGMVEHVGLSHLPQYYQTVHRLLKPGGLYLNHGITHGGRRKKPRTEFRLLTKYIFPGGDLDSIGGTLRGLELAGFEIHDVEGWRLHYARTCRLWHDNLLGNFAAACAEIGRPKARLWLLYLAGCSMAFQRGGALIYQTLVSRRAKGRAVVPPTRADLYC